MTLTDSTATPIQPGRRGHDQPVVYHSRADGWVRRAALLLAIIAATAALVGLVFPQRWEYFGLRVSLRHFDWPATLAIVMGLVYAAKYPRPRGLLLRWQQFLLGLHACWKEWGIGRRLVLVVLVVYGVVCLARVNDLAETAARALVTERTAFCRDRDRQDASLTAYDRLVTQTRQEVPEDARILYEGHWESVVFAYDVYPRRVFLTPQNWRRLAGEWHCSRWLEAKTGGRMETSLERFWMSRIPRQNVPPLVFAEQKGLDYRVTYDPRQPDNTSIEPLTDAP